MKNLSILLLLGLLMFSVQSANAKQPVSDITPGAYSYEKQSDLDFDSNSFYISDEQIQEMQGDKKSILDEEKPTFLQRVINSGHFSSETATKTYIPLNKEMLNGEHE